MQKFKIRNTLRSTILENGINFRKKNVDYPTFVNALFNEKNTALESLVHGALGIAGEAGEFADCVKKGWAYNDDIETIDQENFIEELGDLRFYYQKMLSMSGLKDEDIQAANFAKLSKRYPDGEFTKKHASERLDKTSEEQHEIDFEVEIEPDDTLVIIENGELTPRGHDIISAVVTGKFNLIKPQLSELVILGFESKEVYITDIRHWADKDVSSLIFITPYHGEVTPFIKKLKMTYPFGNKITIHEEIMNNKVIVELPFSYIESLKPLEGGE